MAASTDRPMERKGRTNGRREFFAAGELAGDLLVCAGLDGPGLGHLAAARAGVVAVVIDGRIAARIGVDGRGRNVPYILADDRAIYPAGSCARIGEIVQDVYQSAHLEVPVDREGSRDDDPAVEDSAGVGGSIAADAHRREVARRRGVR